MVESPILRVRGLSKHFDRGTFIEHLLGTRTQTQAVDDVDFHIRRNEVLALVGESGCGKSTLANTLVGLYEPTSGEIELGETLSMDDVGLLFQDTSGSLNPRRTVRQIIATPLRLRGKSDISARVSGLLTDVGLEKDVAGRYPSALSGGQKKRVALARSLANDPKLLIADEPTSGLDVSIQSKLINLLIEIQENRELSVLLITHDLGLAQTISDRIHIMYLGQIVEKGRTKDIFANPAHPYTEALISAVLPTDPTDESARIVLPGEVPDPQNPPSGCRFHTRCPHYLGPVCEERDPPLQTSANSNWPTRDGQTAACHLLNEEVAPPNIAADCGQQPNESEQ